MASFLCAAGLFLVSCGGGKSEEQTDGQTSDSISTDLTPVDSGAAEYSLPSPLQIASIFRRSGLNYQDGLTAPEANVDKFSTSFSQSIGLGVFSADLSYCVLNKQQQASINYMKSVRKLADKLGMASVFDNNGLASRFEKNISNEDSLGGIIAELQMETDLYLEDNEKQHVSAIVFAGAWIESMYIGGKLYDKSKNKKLLSKIVEQMTIMNNIVNVLKSYESKDAGITPIIADFNTINEIYNNFASVKNAATNEDGEKQDVTITDEEAVTLAKKIEEIRTKFLNG